ncbi:hypothetical protein KKG31_05805 [Patescibacteria group bacterium]|nr:hypothetical protein [Patescibacteria group bacterium]MBU1758620.1 hypothetical protein [Patescibacteria group bacterium]MBU1901949.1 hypothetical protein [Patescibacteria group bacterium]
MKKIKKTFWGLLVFVLCSTTISNSQKLYLYDSYVYPDLRIEIGSLEKFEQSSLISLNVRNNSENVIKLKAGQEKATRFVKFDVPGKQSTMSEPIRIWNIDSCLAMSITKNADVYDIRLNATILGTFEQDYTSRCSLSVESLSDTKKYIQILDNISAELIEVLKFEKGYLLKIKIINNHKNGIDIDIEKIGKTFYAEGESKIFSLFVEKVEGAIILTKDIIVVQEFKDLSVVIGFKN